MKHPSEVGFEKAAVVEVRVGGQTVITDATAAWSAVGMLYALVNHENTVFRVGLTGKKLKERIYGYRRIIPMERKLKPSEIEDRRKIREYSGLKPFEVWAKQPSRLTLSLGADLTVELISLMGEEIFWMAYYKTVWNDLR
jgi:hypothetical protein